VPNPRNKGPSPAADILIELDTGGIVLIERKFEPHGWAIPGGFIDYGESAEAAAVREAKEETGLDVRLIEQLYTYSDPARDPRGHTLTVVFIAEASGVPVGDDDAARAGVFTETTLPTPLAFDHVKVLEDYFTYKRTGKHPDSARKRS
jgi:ADP-ribose pyrophosphatase YjhB (NUDIX family)